MDHLIVKDSSEDKFKFIEEKLRKYFKARSHWWRVSSEFYVFKIYQIYEIDKPVPDNLIVIAYNII